jgi:heme-degrading monooxygenase HmoA
MSYIGLSIITPMAGQQEEVERISGELVAYARSLEGCIAAYGIKAADGSGDVGRITIWESEEHANRGVTTMHAMSLRSELHLKIEAGHLDRGFFEIT